MKKLKFGLINLKKNLNLQRLLDCFKREKDFDDPNLNSLDSIIESATEKIRQDFKNDTESEDYYWAYQDKMIKMFYSSLNKKSYKLMVDDIFNGRFLPKLNKNFKREFIFAFDVQSHVLIYSKKNKKYYFFSVIKDFSTKVKLADYYLYFYLNDIFSKKISKRKIFELVMKQNEAREDQFMEDHKDLYYEQREQLWDDTAYISPTGVNYLKLYNKNKL